MPLIIGQGGGEAPQDYTFVSLLSGATASIDNKISSAVSDILPGFVSSNHQGFVNFMEAYYEWMEQIENPHGTSSTLIDLMDVDKTFDSFIEYFMDVYLKDFPKNLATDESGNVLDKKIIIKNINDFYSCKGTEKSYKLFLRILYDSDVEFYYPKEDILRVSDGKWVIKKSIKVTSENRTRNFDLVKTKIEQVERTQGGEVTASATVESILQYSIGQYFVTEMFLTDISGNFLQGRKIRGYDSSGDVLYEDIYSIPSVVEILSMGAGYRSGDGIIIDESSVEYRTGKGSEIKVSGVDKDGGIEQAVVNNFGVNYTSSTTDDKIPLIFRSTSGDGNAQGNILLSALCEYPGYWLDNDGKLSSNKFMRDNVRFHEFSYVLKTETAIDNYREQARKLIHPAGTRLFGDISLLNTISSAIPYHTEIIKMEPPLIGHYTPYTLDTHDNLRGATATGSVVDLYPEGFQPGSTGANHCLGNTGGRIAIDCDQGYLDFGATFAGPHATAMIQILNVESLVEGATFGIFDAGGTEHVFETEKTHDGTINNIIGLYSTLNDGNAYEHYGMRDFVATINDDSSTCAGATGIQAIEVSVDETNDVAVYNGKRTLLLRQKVAGGAGNRANVENAGTGFDLGNFKGGYDGYTLGSFVNGQTFEQKHTGVTGTVFEWNRSSATGGVLFVYTHGGGTALGFTEGGYSFSSEAAGLTGAVTSVKFGNATVYDQHAYTHITGPAGALGSGGLCGADTFGLTYWGISPSFQSASDDISEVITAVALKITSPYTAGYDYSIGNIVQQECTPGIVAEGVVVGWDSGVSGGTGDHDKKIGRLIVQQTSGADFGQGGDCAINEIDNYTGNISVSYNFSGTTTSSTGFRVKIKNIDLNSVLLLPTSGTDEYIFHSGDDEADVVGGYTGTMAGE